MAPKKRREKWVTHTKTEEGTVVTFDMWCCDIDKGDIPANTVKIIIPEDTHIGYITEGAFPKRVVKRLIKSGSVSEYERGYYLGTDKNPFFILLDFLHREYRDGDCFVYGGDKIHPDCEVILPNQITNFAAWRREERHGAVSLKDLIDVLGKENKNALTLENNGVAWSTSNGKLLDSDGNILADFNDELDIYYHWYHVGMFWNKKSELYPIGHLGALGYRFCKVMKKEMGISAYVSTKKETEDELQDIGRLDMTASCKIFNFVLNHGSFDTECG